MRRKIGRAIITPINAHADADMSIVLSPCVSRVSPKGTALYPLAILRRVAVFPMARIVCPCIALAGCVCGVSGLSARLTLYAQAPFWSISLDAHVERWLTLCWMALWARAIPRCSVERPAGYGKSLPVSRAAYPLQPLTRVANFGVRGLWIASVPY